MGSTHHLREFGIALIVIGLVFLLMGAAFRALYSRLQAQPGASTNLRLRNSSVAGITFGLIVGIIGVIMLLAG